MRKQLTTNFNIGYPVILFITAVLLTLLITTGRVTATTHLFQSPPDEPAEEQAEPIEEAPIEAEPTEIVEPTAEVQPDTSIEEAPVEVEPTPIEIVEPTIETQPDTSIEIEPTIPPIQPPTLEPRQLETNDNEKGSRGFIFDRAEFIDTILVFGSYLWICCGSILFLSVPLFLLLLQIRGSSKLRKKKRNQQPF